MQSHLEILKQHAEGLGCVCKENEPMRQHTSFKIGGPARLLIQSDLQSLPAVLHECTQLEIPRLILGKGSNLLISDKGLSGAVIQLSDNNPPETRDGQIIFGAGVSLSRLCKFALNKGLSGLEFAWGIPGSAGGAAYMNAGAYGGEMKDILSGCEHVTPQGEIQYFKADKLNLGYRRSIYAENRCFITKLHLQLVPADRDAIKNRMDELLSRRNEKQPLEYPSAGSIFKRPPGNFAGTLIEECGLKGKTIGGAQVSEKHAGFIINIGGATCEDVKRLIDCIQQEVFCQTGIQLECEVKVIDF